MILSERALSQLCMALGVRRSLGVEERFQAADEVAKSRASAKGLSIQNPGQRVAATLALASAERDDPSNGPSSGVKVLSNRINSGEGFRSFLLYFLRLCLLFFLFWLPHSLQAQAPVGLWKFAESSGDTAADSSGNGHPAALHREISWTTTSVGEAIGANGRDQYLSTPPLDLSGSKAVTVAFWTNRQYSNSGGGVLLETTSDYRYSITGISLEPDDITCHGIRASLHGDVGFAANCYGQPSPGVWHHLAAVFDKTQSGGDQVALYVDGVLQHPIRNLYSSTNTNNFGNDPVYAFSRGGASDFSAGQIAELRIYDRALRPPEINDIFEGSEPAAMVALSAPVTQGTQVWQQGFDFRNTSNFVSDPPNATYVLPTTLYPTSRGGATFGWGQSVRGYDSSAKYDARLAGFNFPSKGASVGFYVDLPSPGTYDVSIALGALNNYCVSGGCKTQLLDGSTVLATVGGQKLSANYFFDSRNNQWTVTDWPKKNASIAVTLTGTRLTVLMGGPQSGYVPIAHLSLAQASPSFAISISPSSITLAQGTTGNSTITTAISGGFNNAITLSASGIPNGTTVSFAPNPIGAPGNGSSAMTINVGTATAVGTYSITVTGSGGGTQHSTTVTFTVTAAAPPQVSLSWNASQSQGVMGYNLYRSLTTGGPYTKINTDLIPGTGYTDFAVQHGGTYYYVSTAVNSQQQESGYSNEASTYVP